MNPKGKGTAIGLTTAGTTAGLLSLLDYAWQFTNLPPLPVEGLSLIAGVLAGFIYGAMPASDRTAKPDGEPQGGQNDPR